MAAQHGGHHRAGIAVAGADLVTERARDTDASAEILLKALRRPSVTIGLARLGAEERLTTSLCIDLFCTAPGF